MSSTAKTNRLAYMDFLKGLGIFFMVLGHASALQLLKVWIYGFHMPLFFYIGGGYLTTINGNIEILGVW